MKLKQLLWVTLAVCALLLVWNLNLLSRINSEELNQNETKKRIAELQIEQEKLNQKQGILALEKEQLIKELNDVVKLLGSAPKLNDIMIENLQDKGITDSEQILIDLLGKEDLVPFDGVLGGTMFISRAWLLTDHYVLAEFEDGHVLGYMILEYEINQQDITWEVIASNMQE